MTTTPAAGSAGTGTSSAGAAATVATEVFLDGQDLGSINSTQADGGWSAFLSLFTGGITSIQTWNTGGAASTVPIPIQGATLTTIQQWTTPAPAPDAAPDPTPSSPTLVNPPQPQGTIRLARAAAVRAAHHAKPAAPHHMARAWDAGFAGRRHHR